VTAHSPEDLRKGYLLALCVVTIWTGFILVSRMGGISTLTAYDTIALRYMVASAILLPFWLYHRHNLWDWRKLMLSLSGALVYSLFIFIGFKHAPANHAAVLLPGFMPFAITAIAWVVLKEVPSRQRRIGLTCIAFGVACIAADTFASSGISIQGDLLLLAGSCCWGMYTVLLRKWSFSPLESTVAITLIAGILYLPVYWLFLPKALDVTPWNTILLQGFYQGFLAPIIQMLIYARAVTLLGPTRLGLAMALIPVTVGLAAVPVLNEPLTHFVMLGLVFVLGGAWLGNRRGRATAAPL